MKTLMKSTFVILTFTISTTLFSQTCDCFDNFKWVKKTFEENDAGFQVFKKNGDMAAYNKFVDSLATVSRSISDVFECREVLDKYSRYLRKGHTGVSLNTEKKNKSAIDYSLREKTTLNIDSLVSKLITNDKYLSEHDPIQGIWEDGAYKIGIVKDNLNNNRDYVGFIITADNVPQWEKGQIKLEISKKDGIYYANYYMRNHTVVKRKIELPTPYELMAGDMVFISPNRMSNSEKFDRKISSTHTPMAIELSDKTTLLIIPSFNGNQKEHIDKVIKDNYDLFTTHENMIIDLRGNGGGADRSFSKLIPFIYTNPIVLHGVVLWASEVNIEHIKNEWWDGWLIKLLTRKRVKKLEKGKGTFVNLNKKELFTRTLKAVLDNPKRVYIIINEENASTTEQFLLNAKQSTKCKLYGQTTFGAIDVSNVLYDKTPDDNFYLSWTLSNTLRPAEQKIDDIGISPDVFINDSIPNDQWIEFVKNAIENN